MEQLGEITTMIGEMGGAIQHKHIGQRLAANNQDKRKQLW